MVTQFEIFSQYYLFKMYSERNMYISAPVIQYVHPDVDGGEWKDIRESARDQERITETITVGFCM